MSVLLVLLSFVFVEGDAAAEKLFESMKKRIMDAETLKIVFDGKFQAGTNKGSFKGTILLAKGNKVHAKFQAEFGERKDEITLVSDGKTRVATVRGKTRTEPVKEDFGPTIRSAIFSTGVSVGFMRSSAGKNAYKPSDFELVKTEKIGKRDAQILKYKLSRDKVVFEVTCWIDVKTKLPLKRVVARQGSDRQVTETTTITLDPKFGEKVFKLPKLPTLV